MCTLTMAFGAGAAAAYLLDSERGHERRARLQTRLQTGAAQMSDARQQVMATVDDVKATVEEKAGHAGAGRVAANGSVLPTSPLETPEDMPTPVGVVAEVEEEAEATGEVPRS